MPQYVIVTPARDEEPYIDETISAVVRQTVQPTQWIIVDDGSSDRTGAIIERWANEYPWITPVHRSNRGSRQPGGGVIEAFYDGLAEIRPSAAAFAFIVKLDADVTFDPEYFERCFHEFDSDPSLGIGGGAICQEVDGRLQIEPTPVFHVRGATKIYRRSCWDALGSLVRAPGWDTIDEIKANMLGWTTRTFNHLSLTQLRRTGAANGIWGDSVKNGRANYSSGYHPIFMLLKCLRRSIMRPYAIRGMGLAWGFISGYKDHSSRVDDAVIKYVRCQQLRRLLLMESVWK